jgi:transcriptional regulator with XRE-family HTH domain
MKTRAGFDPDGNLWDLIAFELRRQRQERNLSLAAVGEIIGRERSLVAHVESGNTKLQEAHARKLDRTWAMDGFFQRLVKYAKAGHDVEWLKTHLELEARASELRIWELSWIPGLFQTEGYARAVFEAFGREDVEAAVRARLNRQECLHHKPRTRVWVIVDQGIIEQPVGSAEIMREQLAHLIELAHLPHISIRVVPRAVGAHVGRDGPFTIMTVDSSDAVYSVAPGGGRLIQDATEIRSFRTWFDLIGDVALPKDASLYLLTEAMERFS